MGLYERIRDVAKDKGYSINALEKELSLPRSSISKYNTSMPSADKLQKIAEFLGVNTEVFWYDDFAFANRNFISNIQKCVARSESTENTYYLDPEVADMAQEIYDKPELRILFDATRNVSKEDLQFVVDMVNRLKKGTNRLIEYIGVQLMDLPHSIRGYTTANDDGSYTIVINARMSIQMQIETYEHEMGHINMGDFARDLKVDELELKRHAG